MSPAKSAEHDLIAELTASLQENNKLLRVNAEQSRLRLRWTQEVLDAARQEAEQIIAAARDEALNESAKMVREARRQADWIIFNVRHQADRIILDARCEAHQIITTARSSQPTQTQDQLPELRITVTTVNRTSGELHLDHHNLYTLAAEDTEDLVHSTDQLLEPSTRPTVESAQDKPDGHYRCLPIRFTSCAGASSSLRTPNAEPSYPRILAAWNGDLLVKADSGNNQHNRPEAKTYLGRVIAGLAALDDITSEGKLPTDCNVIETEESPSQIAAGVMWYNPPGTWDFSAPSKDMTPHNNALATFGGRLWFIVPDRCTPDEPALELES